VADSQPLAGIRVVVTRPERQAGGLVAAFAAAGARVEELPLLAVVPPADAAPLTAAVAAAAGFDWIAFTSANAVDAFFARLDGPPPAGPRLAVVGAATAAALRGQGASPDHVSGGGDAEALGSELAALAAGRLDAGASPLRVLLPQAADARPALAARLAAAGAEVVAVVAYDKRLPAEAAARAREIFGDDSTAPLGWVTFTSPRIVRHFVELFVADWPRRRPTLLAASIGTVTSGALVAAGVEPVAEAARPGDHELVEAVVRAGR
jgi:uroporphyrinogen III methyltransferase / synthase